MSSVFLSSQKAHHKIRADCPVCGYEALLDFFKYIRQYYKSYEIPLLIEDLINIVKSRNDSEILSTIKFLFTSINEYPKNKIKMIFK